MKIEVRTKHIGRTAPMEGGYLDPRRTVSCLFSELSGLSGHSCPCYPANKMLTICRYPGKPCCCSYLANSAQRVLLTVKPQGGKRQNGWGALLWLTKSNLEYCKVFGTNAWNQSQISVTFRIWLEKSVRCRGALATPVPGTRVPGVLVPLGSPT
eukprot:3000369-Rhodomonas_salina.1